MVIYTTISPYNTIVVVVGTTLDRALDLDVGGLTRDWVPAWIVCDTLQLDIDIDGILQARNKRPAA